MKKIFKYLVIMVLLSSCAKNPSSKTDYPVKPVPFTNVHFTDNFWLPRLDTNRIVTIPYEFKKCEETGRIDNFAKAGGLEKGTFVGIRYNDSDVYKIIEGAAYSLSVHPNPELEKYLDALIAKIVAAQEDDGYLYTCRTINPDSLPPYTGKTRWSQLKDSHELYNIGHMYEAAVAYYKATGKRSLLNVAIKSANLVNKVFGPGKDQRHGVPGHQEIEIGLVKLYRVTGDKKYLKLAKYFLDERGDAKGHKLYVYGANGSNKVYTQDFKPVTQQFEAVGHAVRAAYMYSAMTDIAALTGARVISEEVGLKLDSADLSDLGEAHKVVSDKDKTTIVEGKGDQGEIDARINEIKVSLERSTSEFDKEKLQERLAKLAGGVGIIKVGAATEVELKERKHRIEDALQATKAAVEEGIVPGGGVALLEASKVLEGKKGDTDEVTGFHLVKNALKAPLSQIAKNAGKDGAVIVDRVLNEKDGVGYNADTDEYVDMVKAGIIDPAKVTRSALQNATSIASIFLTMEGAVTDLPEEKPETPAVPGGMPGMGGMGMM